MPFLHIESKSIFYTLTPSAASSSSSTTTPLPLTLLFIHGLGSSSSFYTPLIPYLTALGHHCLTFDTYGSGSSSYTGSGNSITSIASDACALLDLFNITQNVVMVGHSMGGIVASHLAASDLQRRIKAVVLIGPVNPGPSIVEVFAKRIGVVEKYGMEPLAASIPTAATGSNSSPVVHSFIRSLLLRTAPAGYVSLCKAILEAPVPQYKMIELPLLMIVGAEDKSAPLDAITYILEQYGSQKKKLRVLEGVGHWHVLEAYSQVQDIIGEFLNRL